jgi:hypothetical protein
MNEKSAAWAGSEIIGLYELDQNGTVLYRRLPDGATSAAGAGVVGKDFFSEAVPMQNADDLRRHFRRFVTSDRAVDNFIFDCELAGETIKTRICMTRGHESNSESNSASIVILDIKEAASV